MMNKSTNINIRINPAEKAAYEAAAKAAGMPLSQWIRCHLEQAAIIKK